MCEHAMLCEDFFVDACGNKRITKKQVKDVTMLNTKDKGLGLTCNEECRKDECVNEHVRLAICKDKLPALLNEHRNKRIFCVMSFDQKTFLDGRKNGRLVRNFNHSCNTNCYTSKWRAQGYLCLEIFAKCDIKVGE